MYRWPWNGNRLYRKSGPRWQQVADQSCPKRPKERTEAPKFRATKSGGDGRRCYKHDWKVSTKMKKLLIESVFSRRRPVFECLLDEKESSGWSFDGSCVSWRKQQWRLFCSLSAFSRPHGAATLGRETNRRAPIHWQRSQPQTERVSDVTTSNDFKKSKVISDHLMIVIIGCYCLGSKVIKISFYSWRSGKRCMLELEHSSLLPSLPWWTIFVPRPW